jgi:hypothetical protein
MRRRTDPIAHENTVFVATGIKTDDPGRAYCPHRKFASKMRRQQPARRVIITPHNLGHWRFRHARKFISGDPLGSRQNTRYHDQQINLGP